MATKAKPWDGVKQLEKHFTALGKMSETARARRMGAGRVVIALGCYENAFYAIDGRGAWRVPDQTAILLATQHGRQISTIGDDEILDLQTGTPMTFRMSTLSRFTTSALRDGVALLYATPFLRESRDPFYDIHRSLRLLASGTPGVVAWVDDALLARFPRDPRRCVFETGQGDCGEGIIRVYEQAADGMPVRECNAAERQQGDRGFLGLVMPVRGAAPLPSALDGLPRGSYRVDLSTGAGEWYVNQHQTQVVTG